MSGAYDDSKIFLYGADSVVVNPKDRMRQLNEKAVESLMESIKKIGQQVPIAVCQTDPRGGDMILAAGYHRLEACRRLGQIVKMRIFRDENAAKLWEISENFHRAELTIDERAAHFAAWEDLMRGEISFAAQTKLKTNENPRGAGRKPDKDSLRERARRAKVAPATVLKFDRINRGEAPRTPPPAAPKPATQPKPAPAPKTHPAPPKAAADPQDVILNQLVDLGRKHLGDLWSKATDATKAAWMECMG